MDAIDFAEHLANGACGKTGEIDLRAIADQLSVRKIEPSVMYAEGCLVKLQDGSFHISYRHDRPRSRRRFTVAHELAHIIIKRCMGISLPPRVERNPKVYSEIEQLADRIAASILMPSNLFIDRFQQLCMEDYSLHGSVQKRNVIDKLASSFSVSQSSVVFRSIYSHPLLIVFFRILLSDNTHVDTPPIFSCDISTSLKLCKDDLLIASRFLYEKKRQQLHHVMVETPFGKRLIKCNGWARHGLGKNLKTTEYWVAGWTWENNDCESYDDSLEV